MRLDRIREQELSRQKGRSWRTILQLIWWAISFVIAYFVSEWLFAQEIFTPQMAYAGGIPRALPEWAIQGGLMVIIVVVIQFFMLLGFMFANPRGRSRSGKASLHSWNPDPDDDRPY